MTNDERADRLEQIRGEVAKLMAEAERLVEGTGARTHWLGRVRAALGAFRYPAGGPTTMARTIEELRGETDEEMRGTAADAPAR